MDGHARARPHTLWPLPRLLPVSLPVLSTVSRYQVKNSLWAQMSPEPMVTLKPIGLKLWTAPSTECRQPREERGRGTEWQEREKLMNMITSSPANMAREYHSISQRGEWQIERLWSLCSTQTVGFKSLHALSIFSSFYCCEAWNETPLIRHFSLSLSKQVKGHSFVAACEHTLQSVLCRRTFYFDSGSKSVFDKPLQTEHIWIYLFYLFSPIRLCREVQTQNCKGLLLAHSSTVSFVRA